MSGKEEEELAGGNVTRVARIEGNVHRDVGPWTPVVHALLAHLERAGFAGSPRVLGFDDDGREVLTYIEGDPGSLQFPRALLRADALTAFGRFIRAFHDAAAGFVPDPSAVYQIGTKAVGPGEIVCHGDLGYWNTVWRGDDVVGLIDWEFAEPERPIFDAATAAISSVPLRDDEWATRVGFAQHLDRRGRIEAFCAGYGGVSPAEVVDAAAEVMTKEMDRLRVFGAEGREPWASFLERGQLRMFEGVARWIEENRDSIV